MWTAALRVLHRRTGDPTGRFASHLERFDDAARELFCVAHMRGLLGHHIAA